MANLKTSRFYVLSIVLCFTACYSAFSQELLGFECVEETIENYELSNGEFVTVLEHCGDNWAPLYYINEDPQELFFKNCEDLTQYTCPSDHDFGNGFLLIDNYANVGSGIGGSRFFNHGTFKFDFALLDSGQDIGSILRFRIPLHLIIELYDQDSLTPGVMIYHNPEPGLPSSLNTQNFIPIDVLDTKVNEEIKLHELEVEIGCDQTVVVTLNGTEIFSSPNGLGSTEFRLSLSVWLQPDDVLIDNFVYTPADVSYHTDTTFQFFQNDQFMEILSDTIVSGVTCTDSILVRIPLNDRTCLGDAITAISPNGDGLNDSFRLIEDINFKLCPIDFSEFSVYNRRGKLIFKSLDAFQIPWDGKDVSGREMPLGYYIVDLRAKLLTGELVHQSFGLSLVR